MNGYERMIAALNREEELDCVPIWELIINEPVITKLYGKISRRDYMGHVMPT